MLEIIIQYLNNLLAGTDYFEKSFKLCDIVYRADGQSFPAEYQSQGNYAPVSNFSEYNGVSYFRKSGNVRMSNVTDRFNIRGCEPMIQFSFPLRLVCCVPKTKAPNDNAFTDDSIVMTLLRVLNTQNDTGLKTALRAAEAITFIEEYDTDNQSILKQEYSRSVSDVDYNFSYIALDLQVNIIVRQSCITSECTQDLYSYNVCPSP